MDYAMGEEAAIHIMGAGLSGLAAATILAKAGKKSMSMMSEPIQEPDLTVISKP